MKLIDGDKLTREVANDYAYIIAKFVDSQPAVDAVPVVYGFNVADAHPVDEFMCSRCEIMLEGWSEIKIDDHDNDKSNMEYEFKFCPNCGAKLQDRVAIEDLKDEWVSVRDGLPKKEYCPIGVEHFLTTYQNKWGTKIDVMHFDFESMEWSSNDFCYGDKVLAWRPLPSMFEEDKQ